MEPTVLAGPVEFSPADIALIVGVLAAMFAALTAPGWAVLGYAAHARRKAQRSGAAWGAAVAGCIGGLVICGAAASVTRLLLQDVGGLASVVALVAAWGACWAIAYAIKPRSAASYADAPAASAPSSPTRPTSEGWGR